MKQIEAHAWNAQTESFNPSFGLGHGDL